MHGTGAIDPVGDVSLLWQPGDTTPRRGDPANLPETPEPLLELW